MAALLLGSNELKSDTPAEGPYGKAADNKIYAQKLVDDVDKANPDVVVFTLHAVAPGATESHIIACTIDVIGKADSAVDKSRFAGRETVLAVKLSEPQKYKAYLPMKDASGNVIGLMSALFKNEPGNDEIHYCTRAVTIRNDVAKRIPNVAALFAPAP